MGWFEEQIKQRNDRDQELLEDSLLRVSGVILGQKNPAKAGDGRTVTGQAVDELLKYYSYKAPEVPETVTGDEERLDFSLRPYGIMKRRITLEEKWYTDAFGPILAWKKGDREPTALIPGAFHGYRYRDRESGTTVRINRKTAAEFEKEAYCFYKPLPQKKLKISDLTGYMRECFTLADILMIMVFTLAVTSTGMLLPRMTKAVVGPIAAMGQVSMLIGAAIAVVCTAVASQLLKSAVNILTSRVGTKTSLRTEAALMMRIMSLPANFFRKYSPGELTSRMQNVNALSGLLVGLFLGTGLSSLASLLYITQIFSYAPALAVPSLLFILATVAFSLVSSAVQIRISKKQMEATARESGLAYSMITGIQKIRLSNAEKRFFARWLNLYTESTKLTFAPPMFVRINKVINLAISLVSTIVLYYLAVKSGVDQPNYFAFTAAYGAVMGAFSSLADMALSLGRVKPIFETAEPILATEPETSDNREIVTELSGGIEVNNVYFRYNDRMPYIAKDLSLKIRPGEYVAVVGRTGCGKSTLIRLLLGFEKPEKGAVYYDGKDLNTLDLQSVRRKIGTVLQNGELLQGDLYSNIVITAPQLTVDDAWEAAETAGIADDIRAMPMGMHTMVSEGMGNISGGQKQRILIARAVAPKPKILIFDEATSALDNKTQKQVSEALDRMGCTRIVIAHRLSTIRRCDRIIVLEDGGIAEDGTYEELITKGGSFAALVEKQRLDRDE